MSMEDEFKRNPPPLPYEPGMLRLFLPLEAVQATHRLLRMAGRRESGVMWYGTKDASGDGTVRYVVAPRQQMRWGNYHVSAEALAEVVHRLPEGLKPLAQAHSHPGEWVEHSTYDDAMVSSNRILSLVFSCMASACTNGRTVTGTVSILIWQRSELFLWMERFAWRTCDEHRPRDWS